LHHTIDMTLQSRPKRLYTVKKEAEDIKKEMNDEDNYGVKATRSNKKKHSRKSSVILNLANLQRFRNSRVPSFPRMPKHIAKELCKIC
ncbi:hypothetical protein PENTCL1PPCAC_3367, partial [Pristionchus entomophagus]